MRFSFSKRLFPTRQFSKYKYLESTPPGPRDLLEPPREECAAAPRLRESAMAVISDRSSWKNERIGPLFEQFRKEKCLNALFDMSIEPAKGGIDACVSTLTNSLAPNDSNSFADALLNFLVEFAPASLALQFYEMLKRNRGSDFFPPEILLARLSKELRLEFDRIFKSLINSKNAKVSLPIFTLGMAHFLKSGHVFMAIELYELFGRRFTLDRRLMNSFLAALICCASPAHANDSYQSAVLLKRHEPSFLIDYTLNIMDYFINSGLQLYDAVQQDLFTRLIQRNRVKCAIQLIDRFRTFQHPISHSSQCSFLQLLAMNHMWDEMTAELSASDVVTPDMMNSVLVGAFQSGEKPLVFFQVLLELYKTYPSSLNQHGFRQMFKIAHLQPPTLGTKWLDFVQLNHPTLLKSSSAEDPLMKFLSAHSLPKSAYRMIASTVETPLLKHMVLGQYLKAGHSVDIDFDGATESPAAKTASDPVAQIASDLASRPESQGKLLQLLASQKLIVEFSSLWDRIVDKTPSMYAERLHLLLSLGIFPPLEELHLEISRTLDDYTLTCYMKAVLESGKASPSICRSILDYCTIHSVKFSEFSLGLLTALFLRCDMAHQLPSLLADNYKISREALDNWLLFSVETSNLEEAKNVINLFLQFQLVPSHSHISKFYALCRRLKDFAFVQSTHNSLEATGLLVNATVLLEYFLLGVISEDKQLLEQTHSALYQHRGLVSSDFFALVLDRLIAERELMAAKTLLNNLDSSLSLPNLPIAVQIFSALIEEGDCSGKTMKRFHELPPGDLETEFPKILQWSAHLTRKMTEWPVSEKLDFMNTILSKLDGGLLNEQTVLTIAKCYLNLGFVEEADYFARLVASADDSPPVTLVESLVDAWTKERQFEKAFYWYSLSIYCRHRLSLQTYCELVSLGMEKSPGEAQKMVQYLSQHLRVPETTLYNQHRPEISFNPAPGQGISYDQLVEMVAAFKNAGDLTTAVSVFEFLCETFIPTQDLIQTIKKGVRSKPKLKKINAILSSRVRDVGQIADFSEGKEEE